jgi:hypothetical protein
METVMAKGQKKSNREAKKPKKTDAEKLKASGISASPLLKGSTEASKKS